VKVGIIDHFGNDLMSGERIKASFESLEGNGMEWNEFNEWNGMEWNRMELNEMKLTNLVWMF
jgi:hypothetical protein